MKVKPTKPWPRRPEAPPNRVEHLGRLYTPCHPGPNGESNLRLRWGGLLGLVCAVCGRRPAWEPAGYNPPPDARRLVHRSGSPETAPPAGGDRWRMKPPPRTPRPDPPAGVDSHRCAVCGWPLGEKSCARGDCTQRPPPTQLYDADRARREYAAAGAPDAWPEFAYPGRDMIAADRVYHAIGELDRAIIHAEIRGLSVHLAIETPPYGTSVRVHAEVRRP